MYDNTEGISEHEQEILDIEGDTAIKDAINNLESVSEQEIKELDNAENRSRMREIVESGSRKKLWREYNTNIDPIFKDDTPKEDSPDSSKKPEVINIPKNQPEIEQLENEET